MSGYTAVLDIHATPPEEIVIDLDATDDRVHSEQEGRECHGCYRSYCLLSLQSPATTRWSPYGSLARRSIR